MWCLGNGVPRCDTQAHFEGTDMSDMWQITLSWKNGGSRSPKHHCPRSLVQYVPVVGTEQALVVVGDSIATADGVEVLGAGQPLSAFHVCSVVIPTAVHLPKEHTATGRRRHSTLTTLTLHETVTRYNLQWVFHHHSTNLCWWSSLGRVESFLQRPPHMAGEEERATAMQPLQCTSVIIFLPFYSQYMDFYYFFFSFWRSKTKDLVCWSWGISRYFILAVSCLQISSDTTVYWYQFRSSHMWTA